MARKIALRVERLEVRALLSGLAFNLTTDKSTYQVGQPVQLTFTETNVSNHAVTVSDGPSIDGFNVTLNGKTIWQSNSGINPQVIEQVTLQPGQSLTENATWNGESGGESSTSPRRALSPSPINWHPSPPARPSRSLRRSRTALTTDKSIYQVGQPIHLTFTETNPSTQAVAVNVVPLISPSRKGEIRSGTPTTVRRPSRDNPNPGAGNRSRRPPPGTAPVIGSGKRSITGGRSSFPIPMRSRARPRPSKSHHPSCRQYRPTTRPTRLASRSR